MHQLSTLLLLSLHFQLGQPFGIHSSRIGRSFPPLHASFKNVEVASICQGGSDPDRPTKVNQDAYFIQHTSDGSGLIFLGIFDGHGKNGHVLNEFLSQRLPQLLEEKCSLYFSNNNNVNEDNNNNNNNNNNNSTSSTDNIENILIESFLEVNEEARLNTEVPSGRSGTTCIVSAIDTKSGCIHTANVGDSRAIIGIRRKYDHDDDHDDDNSDWVVEALSEETTTKREEERSRIESLEGRIDGQGNVWYGPVGIAMTRSLGNAVMRRAGVIPTPEVKHFDLNDDQNENNPCTVLVTLGTDGIFDVFTNEKTIHLIDDKYQETHDLQAAMSALADSATMKWKAGLPFDVKVDDITCVSARFQLGN